MKVAHITEAAASQAIVTYFRHTYGHITDPIEREKIKPTDAEWDMIQVLAEFGYRWLPHKTHCFARGV